MPGSIGPRARLSAHKGLCYGASVLIALLTAGGAVLAQTGGPYNLEWHTFDGGGGPMSGGDYSLSGTIGQADAGAAMTGGDYSLQGGFWVGTAAVAPPPIGPSLYMPMVLSP